MNWVERYTDSYAQVFGSPQRVLSHGNGCTVTDTQGRKYLDLLAGIAVNALGYAHPAWVSSVSEQAAQLAHVSNFFATPVQIRLAERLLELCGAPEKSAVFLNNSGTEANEAAFKLARMHGQKNPAPEGRPRQSIIAFEGAFHGRTMGSLALSAKQAYREPFEPLPPGVVHLPYGDIDAVRREIGKHTAAVIVEPVQGEAGVRVPSRDFLLSLRELTREHGALLIVDEVQTGMGRTGTWFASREASPDAITLAKGLGGGFPIGALVTFGEEASALLGQGSHGSTFGGNPLAAAAALATIETIEAEGLLARARELGEFFVQELSHRPGVLAVRAAGALIGVDIDRSAQQFARIALEEGFIVNAPGPGTIRLAPPLILTNQQAGTFIERFDDMMSRIRNGNQESRS